MFNGIGKSLEKRERLSEALKAFRQEWGLSQRKLAARLEVSQNAVRAWEGGTNFPEYDKLCRIAHLLGFETIMEFENFLEGDKLKSKSKAELILEEIDTLDRQTLAKIVHRATDRLSMVK